MSELREATVWRGEYKGVPFEINRRAKHQEEGFDWTFYVYFIERKCSDFEAIWLEDRISQITPESRPWLTHDYMQGMIADVQWHHGITFYEKLGHTKGHRAVKAGCDYQHYWDEGRYYDLSGIERDVHRAIDSAYALGIFKERV